MNPETEMFTAGELTWHEALKWHRTFSETPEGKLTSTEVRAWQQWLAEPEHQRIFDQVCRLLANPGRYRERSLPSTAEIAADDYDLSVPIAEWRQSRPPAESEFTPPSRRFPWLRLSAALALAASIAVTALWVLGPAQSWLGPVPTGLSLYQTGVGQVKDAHLADGSTVILGPKTKLLVSLTKQERSVTLVRGEAWFQDTEYKHWPFVVSAGHGTISALGTAFVVDLTPDRVLVTVTQGIVAVSTSTPVHSVSIGRGALPLPPLAAVRVTRGQQLTYRRDGTVSPVRHADTKAATSWTHGQLLFYDQPLSQVLTAINRYSARRILVSPAAGKLRFTGLVFTNQIPDWLHDLNRVFPVVVTEQSTQVCVHMANRGTSGRTSGSMCTDNP